MLCECCANQVANGEDCFHTAGLREGECLHVVDLPFSAVVDSSNAECGGVFRCAGCGYDEYGFAYPFTVSD